MYVTHIFLKDHEGRGDKEPVHLASATPPVLIVADQGRLYTMIGTEGAVAFPSRDLWFISTAMYGDDGDDGGGWTPDPTEPPSLKLDVPDTFEPSEVDIEAWLASIPETTPEERTA